MLITAVVGLVAHADKTIYYDNSATNWSLVKIHYWGGSTNGDVTMTKVDGADNIYKGSIPDDATNMIFFSHGILMMMLLRMLPVSWINISIMLREPLPLKDIPVKTKASILALSALVLNPIRMAKNTPSTSTLPTRMR